MQIQRLSENTIKVILTKEDFARRNIDIKKLRPGSQTYRKLVLEVMAQASGEFNFDVNDCRLVVEGQMSLKNELTLLITKSPVNNFSNLSDKNQEDRSDRLPSPEELTKILEDAFGSLPFELPTDNISEKSSPETVFPTSLVIRFKEFDNLISLLHSIPDIKSIASSLYMYNNAYYLVLKVYERNLSLAIIFRNRASEFDGDQIPEENIMSSLTEHGTLVIKRGAIPFLLKNFSE